MNTVSGWVLRDHAELLAAFHGLDLVDPGLVNTTEWLSPSSSTQSWMHGAVALPLAERQRRVARRVPAPMARTPRAPGGLGCSKPGVEDLDGGA